MLKLFGKCPACGGSITITEIKCPHCQLVMRAEFAPGPFSALSDDQFTFVRAFLRVRGNLTELEKVLGVSYPTIRNKLDEINATLDQADSPATGETASQMPAPEANANPFPGDRSVLQQVAEGKLSPLEAVERLRNLKGG